MNANLKINTSYAVTKAARAVKSWEDALAEQIQANDAEGIEFCARAVATCKANLEAVRKDVRENWHMYL